MSANDALLFERWRQRGDAEAFAEIVSRYSGMVYATCQRVLRNAEEAQEAAQDSFVELMRASIDPSLALGPWLHMVAVRHSLEHLRKSTRRAQQERDSSQDEDDLQFEADSGELLALIDEAIAALPGPLRVVIIGRFLERRPPEELAETLGIAEATVRQRVEKGVEQVGEILDKRGVEVEPYLLNSVMGYQLTGTAPASLTVALGKLALAGPVPHPEGGGAAATVGTGSGRGWAWKVAALLTVIALGAAATTGLVLNRSKRPTVEPVAAQSTAKRFVARDRKSGPASSQQTTPAVAPGKTGVSTAGADAAKPGANAAKAPIVKSPHTGIPTNPSAISGIITDDKGQGIAGARVSAAAWDSVDSQTMLVWQGETDADGQYTVSGIDLGAHDFVDVSVSADGHQTDGRRVDAKAGENHKDINFTLSGGVTLHGRVLDLSGAPMQAATVVCRSANFRPGGGSTNYHLASTNEQGLFSLGFRGEGIASLLVVPPGHPEGFFPAVAVSEAKTVDLKMSAPASLAGRALLPDGTPAAGVDIALHGRYAPDGGTPNYAKQVKSWNAAEIGTAYIRQAVTGPDGSYSFADLPAVPDLLLDFNRPPEGNAVISVKLFSLDAGPLAPGEHKTFDCTLPSVSEVMTIRGRLLGMHSGRPVDGMVAYENTRTREGSSVSGDPRNGGAYELKLIVPGTYELWGRHSSNAADSGMEPRVSVPFVAGTSRTVDVLVPDPFTLSIRVIDAEGMPVQGARVEAGQGTRFPNTKTDGQGRYSWDGFAPGIDGHFTVDKEGYRRAQSQPIAGEPGAVYPEETIVLHRIDEPEEVYPRPEEAMPRQEEVLPKPEEALPKPAEPQPNPEAAQPRSNEAQPAQGELLPVPEGVMMMPDDEPAQTSRGHKSSRRR